MSGDYPIETFVDTKITYSVTVGGKLVVVEHVPARVCQETGEQFFTPETVKRIQQIVQGHSQPIRIIETPVYEFAA